MVDGQQTPRPKHDAGNDEREPEGGLTKDGVPEQSDPRKEPLTPSGDQRVAVEE